MKPLILIILLVITGCTSLVYNTANFESLYGPSSPKARVVTQPALLQNRLSFVKDVKPILDSRCVACHGCYDAPCQLKLGSIDGIDRGANKQPVYDFARLTAVPPTRLFVDATDTKDWRGKGFHSVLNERNDSAVANLDNSILAKLIQLKRLNPQPLSGRLNEDFDLGFDHPQQCATVDEFAQYQHEHPKWGMPYAMPGLSLKEEYTLLQWLQEGAKVEPSSALSADAQASIQKWEDYFNQPDLKHKLVSRYIYEHLFIGHMHFKYQPQNEFYQWVRSKTPSGQPIVEINTVRPYDDPGPTFYYRLRPVTETIVDKNHFVYELSDEKMHRYDALFFDADYQVTTLPGYDPAVGANPFSAFNQLPITNRYQFLLDDAYYFVSGFIKGPVCRGDSATSSIRDRFWVVFSQPGMIDTQKVSQALAENNHILGLPGEESDQIDLFGFTKYDEFAHEYLAKKNQFLQLTLPKDKGFGLQNIWDGEGHNQNAALTIFRHGDSATVTQGFIGSTPLTGWVVDYPIFERLHYLLVAGFNVFGTAGHQLATRTYMDIVRQDAEDNFLRFMPIKQRQTIYDSWYQGSKGFLTADPFFNLNNETQVQFSTTDYKKEFFEQIRQRLGVAAGKKDLINACDQLSCSSAESSPAEQSVESQIRDLAKLKGPQLNSLPEMSLLRVKMPEGETDLVYTLLVNKFYSNISRLLFQDSLRLPENDTLTVAPGFIGSYPNFFFSVDKSQLGDFISRIRDADTPSAMEALYSQYGIRRTNPDIWQQADWFNQQHIKYRGLEAGLLDLNRYNNL